MNNSRPRNRFGLAALISLFIHFAVLTLFSLTGFFSVKPVIEEKKKIIVDLLERPKKVYTEPLKGPSVKKRKESKRLAERSRTAKKETFPESVPVPLKAAPPPAPVALRPSPPEKAGSKPVKGRPKAKEIAAKKEDAAIKPPTHIKLNHTSQK